MRLDSSLKVWLFMFFENILARVLGSSTSTRIIVSMLKQSQNGDSPVVEYRGAVCPKNVLESI